MTNTVKSTSERNKSLYGANSWSYIKIRQQYLKSIGDFRCFGSEKGEKRCEKICRECGLYYVNDKNT